MKSKEKPRDAYAIAETILSRRKALLACSLGAAGGTLAALTGDATTAAAESPASDSQTEDEGGEITEHRRAYYERARF